MRLYVVVQDQRTTVSVDDQLIGYLVRRLEVGKAKPAARRSMGGGLDAAFARSDAVEQSKTARLWIQDRIDAAAEDALLPTSGLSQWVQARIIDAIADPALKDKKTAASEAALDARIAVLYEQRRQRWQQSNEARERQVALREQLLGRLGAVPRYSRPPRRPVGVAKG